MIIIPNFPNFSPLLLEHKEAIDKISMQLQGYADISFTNLWTWDTDESTQISNLDGNLVIKMLDYTGDHMVFTFFGRSNVSDSIRQVLRFAQSTDLPAKIALCPEPIIELLPNESGFELTEDENNSDYILDCKKVHELKGGEFKRKRLMISRFLSRHPGLQFQELDISDKSIQKKLRQLIETWKSQTDSEKIDPDEFIAIDRAIRDQKTLGIKCLGYLDGDELVAFSFVEFLDEDYGLVSFEKANKNYTGIYTALNQYEASFFLENNRRYMNIQQDLGIEGLRTAKQAWSPVKMMKKYTVTLKS